MRRVRAPRPVLAALAVPALALLLVGAATVAVPPVVRLRPADAARRARAARDSVNVRLADGLVARVWATDTLLADPVALDVDGSGTVYVTGNGRSDGKLDIRGHPDWVPTVHTLTTADALRAFYRRELAPARSARNEWIPDYNRDGSHDWRDFTVPKDRVYRLRDESGDGVADVSQLMYEGFDRGPEDDVAGGLLLHDGAIYVGAAPDVWRMRDTNGDGVIDRRDAISTGYNVHPAFFGHGIAGLTLGPDGRLYWSVGDLGTNVVDRDGKRWSYPNQGVIARANPDGSGFEIFAAGLRNSQAIAFDEWGNLVGVDNDGDHPGETERVVYITDGSDAGWRSQWQYGKYTDPANNRYKVWMDEGMFRPRFDGQAAWFTPPIAAAHAGPASLVYNPGTALGPRWRHTFLVSSFAGSPTTARIYAFRLRSDGAGFALASDSVAIGGVLTVGLRFGPEGALYLADWIDGWSAKGRGRIWTVDSPADTADPLRAEVRGLLRASFASSGADRLRALLRHADLRIRQRAQLELVRRADAATLAAAAAPAPPAPAAPADTLARLARAHAIWGLGQLARGTAPAAASAAASAASAAIAALAPLLGDADPEIRAQAARTIGDVPAAAAGAAAGAVAGAVVPLLADSSARVRFFAAQALGRLRHAAAVPGLVRVLAENDDRDVYLRQAATTALARIGDPAPLVALASHASHVSRAARIGAIVALRRLKDPGVARFLDDRDPYVVAEAARAIEDDGGIPAALPALARLLGDPRAAAGGEPLLRRALAANLRTGTPDAVERVAAFAARADAPEALRVDAVAALGTWPDPSPMDRVDGAWLGAFAPRDPVPARAAVLALVAPLLGGGSEALRVAVADAAGRLGATGAAPALLAQVRGDGPAAVRLASLQALRQIGGAELEPAVRHALGSADSTVRSAALGMLPVLRLADTAGVRLLTTAVERGSTAERQAAIAMLGAARSPAANAALGTLVDRLAARTLAPELALDVVEAAQASGAPALRAKLERVRTSRAAPSFVAALGESMAEGGDAQRGRQVIFGGGAAQCTRCHAFGPTGGASVGPNLAGVGSRLTRAQLLQALLEPSARLAPGYGTVALTLRDGRSVLGTLAEETRDTLVVDTAPGKPRRVAVRDIAKRVTLPSPMPPMGTLLKPREIRDVVAYLARQR